MKKLYKVSYMQWNSSFSGMYECEELSVGENKEEAIAKVRENAEKDARLFDAEEITNIFGYKVILDNGEQNLDTEKISITDVANDVSKQNIFDMAIEEACRQWCDFINEAPERKDGEGFAKFFYDIFNEKVSEVMASVTNNIKDEDAEVLMQFKNPMELIMAVGQRDRHSLNPIRDTVEYVNSHDIYTLPFELNHSKVTNEAKQRHKALEEILHIIPNPSFKSSMGWLSYFRNIAVEYEDESMHPENPYTDFISMLERIRGEFGMDILQKIYDFGCEAKDWDICEDSLYTIAEYLEDRNDTTEVSEMAQSGYFLQSYEELQKQLEQGEVMDMNM